MDKNNSLGKRTIFGALIITMSLIIIGISGSYAFFNNAVVKTGDGGLTLTSGDLTLSFDTTDTISLDDVNLISADEYTSKAPKTSFKVSLQATPEHPYIVDNASYYLYFTDLKLSANLKSNYVKWALHKGGVKVADGDFGSISLSASPGDDGLYTASDVRIYPKTSGSLDIAKGGSDSYILYVWLENSSTENQNTLLNGTLSFKVGFTATPKTN